MATLSMDRFFCDNVGEVKTSILYPEFKHARTSDYVTIRSGEGDFITSDFSFDKTPSGLLIARTSNSRHFSSIVSIRLAHASDIISAPQIDLDSIEDMLKILDISKRELTKEPRYASVRRGYFKIFQDDSQVWPEKSEVSKAIADIFGLNSSQEDKAYQVFMASLIFQAGVEIPLGTEVNIALDKNLIFLMSKRPITWSMTVAPDIRERNYLDRYDAFVDTLYFSGPSHLLKGV